MARKEKKIYQNFCKKMLTARITDFIYLPNKSIKFKGSFKNFHLSGLLINLKTYSILNQAIQMLSTCVRMLLGLEAGPTKSGKVVSVSVMVETTMKETDTMARILAAIEELVFRGDPT